MTGTSFQNRVWDEIKNIPQAKLEHTKKLQFLSEVPVHQELLPMLAQPTQIQSLYHVIG